jgi:hypothetical protein
MFFIAGKPYHLPIVECRTLGDGLPVIDPDTGDLRTPEELQLVTDAQKEDLHKALDSGDAPPKSLRLGKCRQLPSCL